MNTICIYHDKCADGFGAAWVVRKALGPQVEFYAATHGHPAPDVTGKEVIIVDFSYPLETLTAMAAVATSVLVLDHHKTAQAALSAVPTARHCRSCQNHDASDGRLHALFDMDRSGAGLTWDYYFPERPRPGLIDHIEDRDLWRFKLNGTREITASLFSYPYDFDVWDRLVSLNLDELKNEGIALERKHQKDVAELVRASKRRMSIGGFDVPVANLPPTMASDAGNLMCAGEPFAACYWDTPDGRAFSLRSTDEGEDVSAIAKLFGGGGHRNAAGFRVAFDHTLTQESGRTDKDYAIEHAEYLAIAADLVSEQFNAYGSALMAHEEAEDDTNPELYEDIDSARQDLQEALTTLRNYTYEFRKRRDRAIKS